MFDLQRTKNYIYDCAARLKMKVTYLNNDHYDEFINHINSLPKQEKYLIGLNNKYFVAVYGEDNKIIVKPELDRVIDHKKVSRFNVEKGDLQYVIGYIKNYFSYYPNYDAYISDFHYQLFLLPDNIKQYGVIKEEGRRHFILNINGSKKRIFPESSRQAISTENPISAGITVINKRRN